MPQKKNPDVPELIRGKTGRSIGNLNFLLVLMKSQPSLHNKDNQEDKEPLFDNVDTMLFNRTLGIIAEIEVNEENMLKQAQEGYSTPQILQILVSKSVLFREAHEIVGKAVAKAISMNKGLHELDLHELNEEDSEFIGPDVYDVLSVEGSIKSRDHEGATAPKQVRRAIDRLETDIALSYYQNPIKEFKRMMKNKLEYIGSVLHQEQVSLVTIAETTGTPSFVYSKAKLLEQYQALKDALEGLNFKINYSVKANSNLSILLLKDEGSGFDIVSAGELAECSHRWRPYISSIFRRW